MNRLSIDKYFRAHRVAKLEFVNEIQTGIIVKERRLQIRVVRQELVR